MVEVRIGFPVHYAQITALAHFAGIETVGVGADFSAAYLLALKKLERWHREEHASYIPSRVIDGAVVSTRAVEEKSSNQLRLF